jgi:hypothetical protein
VNQPQQQGQSDCRHQQNRNLHRRDRRAANGDGRGGQQVGIGNIRMQTFLLMFKK